MILPDAVRVSAQAKINVRLRVLAREDNGFHQLETLFLRIALADEVRVRRTPRERSLDVRGDIDLNAIGPVEKNLAWRAAQEHARMTEWRGGFAIEIDKRIPIGGGLGGGSADAGAVIRAMNAMTTAPTNALRLAEPLGADVPFLASELLYALAWGRGERLLPLPPPPASELLLVIPAFGISTRDAFAWFDLARPQPEGPRIFNVQTLSDWGQLAVTGRNDLEMVAFGKHPEIKELLSLLQDAGALVARMSGSGSVLFAVPKPGRNIEELAAAIPSGSVRLIRSNTATHVEPVIPIE